ncbi:uncharacterized protein CMC5_015890 [Chondromyces crocatus]|uniref:tRNA-uridine aminocarboxypropyltransferase n=2 Tax=Chondromyces crocatus TaxID=52 RepID=A0A0K1EA40_CHOCO|nr:uncharacterized protein CMC5_015890 [Chondromyces crocatus]
MAVTPRTSVVLLMHHAELYKSTSTGRLLHRVIPSAHLRLRGAPEGPAPAPLLPERRLLLFPDPSAPVISPELVNDEPVALLIPDGTWKQARRITQRDPAVLGAQRVNLPPGAPSRYGLRRSPRPEALSSFEAAARALGVLEGEAIETRLMAAFDLWVERSREVREHGEQIAPSCRAGA